MSLNTWLEEFMPIPADSLEALERPAQHAYRKWQGLTPENLAKHKCFRALGQSRIRDRHGATIQIGADECALCARYWIEFGSCSACPIVQLGYPHCNLADSAFRSWFELGSPARMLQVLQECVQLENKQLGEQIVKKAQKQTQQPQQPQQRQLACRIVVVAVQENGEWRNYGLIYEQQIPFVAAVAADNLAKAVMLFEEKPAAVLGPYDTDLIAEVETYAKQRYTAIFYS